MTLLFFLKIFTDLCYYFVFAGFAANLFGQDSLQFSPLLLLAAVAALCRWVWDKRPYEKKHLLPLPLLALAFLPPADAAGHGALIPAAAYVCWTVCTLRLHPNYYDAADLFRLELKILPLPALVAFALQQARRIEAFSAPYLLVFLLASVFYLRMVRHDEATLRQPKLRLLNGLSLAALCLVCAIMGSPWFRSIVLSVLKGAWRVVSFPILLAALAVGMAVALAAQAVLPEDYHVDPEKFQELLANLGPDEPAQAGQAEQAASQGSQVFQTAFSILGAVLAVLFILWLFRRLAANRRRSLHDPGGVQSRYAAAPLPPKEKPLNRLSARTPAQQVRYWYLQLLRKTLREGGLLQPSMDTRAQVGLAEDLFPPERHSALRRLRQLYLRARYDDHAAKEDAREAKALYQQVEK